MRAARPGANLHPMAASTAPEDRPRAMHDLGGVSRFVRGPADPSPQVLTAFAKQADAIRRSLGVKRAMSRGETGTTVRRLGDFPNPEGPAFARPAARPPLHHVRFALPPIWPEPRIGDGNLVELVGPWLEAFA
jgi:hypothetical protein